MQDRVNNRQPRQRLIRGACAAMLTLVAICLAGCDEEAAAGPDAALFDPDAGVADATALDANLPDAEPCASGCYTAPLPACISGTTLRSYVAPGSCVNDSCAYPSTDRQCDFGCAAGACRPDPCAGVSCTTAPDAYCVGWEHLRVYSSPGTCSDGDCEYTSTDQPCDFMCSDGACMADPCAGVSCTTPPDAYCVDSEHVRAYASTGTCITGECDYDPAVIACAELGTSPAMCWEGGCYFNACGGCTDPPQSYCELDYASSTAYRSTYYVSPGTCLNPDTDTCHYSSTTTSCPEDCTLGICHQTACSLNGYECDAPLGCKQVGAAELRCLPVDDLAEGFGCSAGVPGYRCGSQLTCVWPDFATTSVCAYLCTGHSDCAGVGLLDGHYCQTVPGSAYGYCI